MGYDKKIYLKLLQEEKVYEANKYRIENIPETLFKFMYLGDVPSECKEKCDIEKVNDSKFNSLENKKFWMSSRENLNDPFEIKTLYIDEKITKKYNYPVELTRGLTTAYENQFLIGCFTTNLEKNMPMWAHYANNHRGFCVGYTIKKPENFYPIAYEDNRHQVNNTYMNSISLIMKEREGTITNEERQKLDIYSMLLFHNSTIKHISWDYENEYRLLFSKIEAREFIEASAKGGLIPNDVLGIEVNAIYIGMSCDYRYKEKLKQIGKKLKIKVYEMYFDEMVDKYELSYREIG